MKRSPAVDNNGTAADFLRCVCWTLSCNHTILLFYFSCHLQMLLLPNAPALRRPIRVFCQGTSPAFGLHCLWPFAPLSKGLTLQVLFSSVNNALTSLWRAGEKIAQTHGWMLCFAHWIHHKIGRGGGDISCATIIFHVNG